VVPGPGPGIVGKCHRASFFRMIGQPQTDPPDAISLRRMRMGSAMEADLVDLAKKAGIFVANGVRVHVAEIDMPLELDLVVCDPDRLPVIVENKTIYGWFGNKKVIEEGQPKPENVMQAAIYLNEFRSGADIKHAVATCMAERQQLADEIELMEKSGRADGNPVYKWMKERLGRYRLVYDPVVLDAIDDEAKVRVKLAYESRDTCQTREFDISIVKGTDGYHYVLVDGQPAPGCDFTVESIYERYLILQQYYRRARQAAAERLKERGIEINDGGGDSINNEEWKLLAEELKNTPADLWPPAEYDYMYTPEQIERYYEAGLISKTAYRKWKSDPSQRLGDWQCAFCSYKRLCVSQRYPHLAPMLLSDQPAEEF